MESKWIGAKVRGGKGRRLGKNKHKYGKEREIERIGSMKEKCRKKKRWRTKRKEEINNKKYKMEKKRNCYMMDMKGRKREVPFLGRLPSLGS